jgi:hypothetical protein
MVVASSNPLMPLHHRDGIFFKGFTRQIGGPKICKDYAKGLSPKHTSIIVGT